MLTTVATFREPWEAHMFRGRLEAEGILAMIAHEHHVGVFWPYSTALGGVKVQVPHEMESDALTIELRCRNGTLKAELQAELGDLDDIHCQACGATHFSKRRPLPQLLICIVLSVFAGPTPPWRWIRYCENCGTKFKLRPPDMRERPISQQVDLSEPVTQKILNRFSPDDYKQVADLLIQYGGYPAECDVERVRLDILEICDSDLNKVRALVTLAKRDFRDLIVAAEYDYVNGKLVLKPQFARPK